MGKVISVDLLWIFCLFGISCVHHHIYLRSFSCAWFAFDVLAKCIFDVCSIKLITHSVFHISFMGYLVSESMFCFCVEHNSFGGLVLFFFALSKNKKWQTNIPSTRKTMHGACHSFRFAAQTEASLARCAQALFHCNKTIST